ncbi:MAG: hypothetical protein WDK96_01955 [Candidatus Paceibacterota bacterium]|jgi:hypothetical protein
MKNGIQSSFCVHSRDNNTTTHTIVKNKITKDDEFFQLAFRDHLLNKSFYVVEIRNDIDEKINTLIKIVELDDKLKKILEQLSQMTYLEKTCLLEKLKDSILLSDEWKEISKNI